MNGDKNNDLVGVVSLLLKWVWLWKAWGHLGFPTFKWLFFPACIPTQFFHYLWRPLNPFLYQFFLVSFWCEDNFYYRKVSSFIIRYFSVSFFYILPQVPPICIHWMSFVVIDSIYYLLYNHVIVLALFHFTLCEFIYSIAIALYWFFSCIWSVFVALKSISYTMASFLLLHIFLKILWFIFYYLWLFFLSLVSFLWAFFL